MKQILILVLSLAPAWTCSTRCYSKDELDAAAERRLGTLRRRSREPAVGGAPARCPTDLYQLLPAESLGDRSLSPWKYVRITNDDYVPSTYVQAECLCSGCVLVQDQRVQESHDYNSVPIMQTRVFLKREQCRGGSRYRLTPVYESVVVGCTCARVKVSS